MGTPSVGVTDVSDSVSYQGVKDCLTAVIHWCDHLEAQYNSALTKLDSDAGVTDTNYNALNAVLDAQGYAKDGLLTTGVVDISDVSFDSLREVFEGILHYLTDLRTKYNATLTKLDADATVTDTNYNALKNALDVAGFLKDGAPTSGVPVIVGSIAKNVVNAVVKDALNALHDWLTDFKVRYDATLTKLDADATVTDTDYAATNPAPVVNSYFTKA